jgi:hypothetical protein
MSQGFRVDMLGKLPGLNGRYQKLSILRHSCYRFSDQAGHDEEQLKLVCDNSTEALHGPRVSVGEVGSSQYDQVPLQTRGALLAMSLFLRCEVVGITDFIAIYHAQHREQGGLLDVDFSSNRDLCVKLLIDRADISQDILQQAEGHIFWAQFAALECEVMGTCGTGASYHDLRALANAHLDSARELCDNYPNQTSSVVDEVREVRRLLDEGGYQSQMRMVVAAMANEFTGTGHWYICENGHPFNVGECGMPMQTARCPQCDAPVGGQNHAPAAGVVNAEDIEREFGNLGI